MRIKIFLLTMFLLIGCNTGETLGNVYKLGNTGYEVSMQDECISFEVDGKKTASLVTDNSTNIIFRIIKISDFGDNIKGLKDIEKKMESNLKIYSEEDAIKKKSCRLLGKEGLEIKIETTVAEKTNYITYLTTFDKDNIYQVTISGTDKKEVRRASSDVKEFLVKS